MELPLLSVEARSDREREREKGLTRARTSAGEAICLVGSLGMRL